jgi:hypothetical protein
MTNKEETMIQVRPHRIHQGEQVTIDQPLRLAIGSHQAGSGKGCAMNVVSWENGDTTISDMPACADPFLARVVQRVNDSICDHRDGDLLCPSCSILVLDLAHRTVGTGLVDITDLDRRRVWVRIAATEARSVLHLTGKRRPGALKAIRAAEKWADKPSAAAVNAAVNAAAAYAAADAAAAYAAATAAAAYAAATAAATALDALDAADDAYATAYAARLGRAHRIIDQFNELTGHQPTPTPIDVTAHAIELMLTPV